ncbi:hypothetical protein [Streptomyces sp. I4(2020)]|uniref:hypothetical protein n=1 Tax=Streptomyces sp. I4(2020) TaxID=2760981 RepID=UPI0018EE89DE|nr:hypothetical protein [Streptomyces sp. I4(2020)]MBJ6613916.1 hypothetical protein [Streptomyces sp. I3(2020)]MBJ6628731.1 hypothetical protein [Streptomyces sp. I4(2020)]
MTIVERRKALLDEALAVASAPEYQALTAEAGRLAAAAARDRTDRACWLALLARLDVPDPTGGAHLLDLLASDPALTALGSPPLLTQQAARSLVSTARECRARGTRIGLGDISTLRDAAGPEALEELAGVMHAQWLAVPAPDRPYLERDVAVLLPLRLETMLSPEDDHVLWLRIVPDEASILRDDPTPKPAEASQLAAMWQEIASGLSPAEQALDFADWLDKPVGRQAFATLCTQVGPGRAAWLTTACPPANNAGTVSIDTSQVADAPPAPNRVGGLPARLEVWWAFGEDEPEFAEAAQPDPAVLVFDVIGSTQDGTDHERNRWWADWQAAKSVGPRHRDSFARQPLSGRTAHHLRDWDRRREPGGACPGTD